MSVLLEDMGLNLQSMMASPHVRAFLDEVRRWESQLSLVGEAMEVWMRVQRRWMYLEAIFIGSDDIRFGGREGGITRECWTGKMNDDEVVTHAARLCWL